jgi:hypothetical protein
MKHKLTNERDFQDYARLLKNFYGEFQSYVIINGVFVLVWLLADGGYFWPVWPIVIWGISLFLKASKLGVIDTTFYAQCHAFRERMPFFKPGWEEQKVEELIQKARMAGREVKQTAEKVGGVLAHELGVVKEFGDKTIHASKEKSENAFQVAKHTAHEVKDKVEEVAGKTEKVLKAAVKAAKKELDKPAAKTKSKSPAKKSPTKPAAAKAIAAKPSAGVKKATPTKKATVAVKKVALTKTVATKSAGTVKKAAPKAKKQTPAKK